MNDTAEQLRNAAANAKKTLGTATAIISQKAAAFGIPVDKITQQREKAVKWINENKGRVIGGLVIISIIIFYFVAIYNRIPRYLSRMEVYDMALANAAANHKITNGNYVLGDFWIASSYKSYLPCTNSTDYSSIESIKACLKYGARFIDLDIFNSGIFDKCPVPVVCNGKEQGNWHYTTELSFDKVCKEISIFAFNPKEVANYGDPLFLSLNFNTWGNKNTINKAATIITKYFSESNRLLAKYDQKYAYQGRKNMPSSINMAAEPIAKLHGKIIIVCTGEIKNTDMDELCQIYGIDPSIPDSKRSKLNIGDFDMRIKTHKQIVNYSAQEAKELKNYNKGAAGNIGLTKVIPGFTNRGKENYNCWVPFYYGCTFICMNYTEPTDFMISYIERFKTCSFLLKPYRLRYHPKYIYPPPAQSKAVSFAPRKKCTDSWCIDY